MKTRTDLLNHLAEKHQLKRYLEIGVQNTEQNFNKIKCPMKRGVDPNKCGPVHDDQAKVFHVTSDKYFEAFGGPDGEKFDLIFIDGLHTAEQVKKDFENALTILSPNGFIVLHDCNPEKEEHTIVPRPTERGHWNGDVYRFAIMLCCRAFTLDQAVTVDIDNGMVVFSGKQTYSIIDEDTVGIPIVEWQNFNENRKEALNLISWDDFIKL